MCINNFRLISKNISAYFVILMGRYYEKYNFNQIFYLSGAIDAQTYLRKGMIDAAQVSDAVLAARQGRLQLGRHSRLVEDGANLSDQRTFVLFVLNMLGLIFRADTRMSNGDIIKSILSKKADALSGMAIVFNRKASERYMRKVGIAVDLYMDKLSEVDTRCLELLGDGTCVCDLVGECGSCIDNGQSACPQSDAAKEEENAVKADSKKYHGSMDSALIWIGLLNAPIRLIVNSIFKLNTTTYQFTIWAVAGLLLASVGWGIRYCRRYRDAHPKKQKKGRLDDERFYIAVYAIIAVVIAASMYGIVLVLINK